MGKYKLAFATLPAGIDPLPPQTIYYHFSSAFINIGFLPNTFFESEQSWKVQDLVVSASLFNDGTARNHYEDGDPNHTVDAQDLHSSNLFAVATESCNQFGVCNMVFKCYSKVEYD